MIDLSGLNASQVWSTKSAFHHLSALTGTESKRTAERRLHDLRILPPELDAHTLVDESGRAAIGPLATWAVEQARRQRRLILFAQLAPLPDGQPCLHANDARGARYWLPLPSQPDARGAREALQRVQQHIQRSITVLPSGLLAGLLRDAPSDASIEFVPQIYRPVPDAPRLDKPLRRALSTHLRRLENESIFMLREAVAEAENPVMLYSAGKDSSVMLHLARKAFYPAAPPFPLLHVDTQWKFQSMYQFRDSVAQATGMRLLTHINPEARARNINPFDHGTAHYIDIAKTEGLKQALDQNHFDVVFCGARREEERSRAKERVFSLRTPTHRWAPENQRPEFWSLYNTRKNRGESIRVFPLSNWTELDIWQYIREESIPVVPLYFAKPRPVVMRDGMIMMVDDERCQILADDEIQIRNIRFRTLGCYPLTGAIESDAATVDDILLELINARQSEHQGREIDGEKTGSMERKKQQGYF